MSYPIQENYIEEAITRCVKKLEVEITEFYLNGSNTPESDLSDMVSFRAFREGVIDELKPTKVDVKAMEALDENLK